MVLPFLLMFLIGCATSADPVVQTRTVREGPPEALFPACEEPPVRLETNGDLARAFYSMRAALTECRGGVEALQDWSRAEATK